MAAPEPEEEPEGFWVVATSSPQAARRRPVRVKGRRREKCLMEGMGHGILRGVNIKKRGLVFSGAGLAALRAELAWYKAAGGAGDNK